jgi:hypothetical protein
VIRCPLPHKTVVPRPREPRARWSRSHLAACLEPEGRWMFACDRRRDHALGSRNSRGAAAAGRDGTSTAVDILVFLSWGSIMVHWNWERRRAIIWAFGNASCRARRPPVRGIQTKKLEGASAFPLPAGLATLVILFLLVRTAYFGPVTGWMDAGCAIRTVLGRRAGADDGPSRGAIHLSWAIHVMFRSFGPCDFYVLQADPIRRRAPSHRGAAFWTCGRRRRGATREKGYFAKRGK